MMFRKNLKFKLVLIGERRYRTRCEVRDLLGGDYYVDFDDNQPDGKKVGLGDIITYHNETTVC